VGALVDVQGRCLYDQQAAGVEELGRSVQQAGGVAADAYVAVHQQDRAPAALGGQRLEDGAPQGLPA
jgi:hypothetical protein